MRHALVLLFAATAACNPLESKEGMFVEYDIHADQDFDHILVWGLDSRGARPAPLTPELLSSGMQPPAEVDVRSMWFVQDEQLSRASSYHFSYGDRLHGPDALAVIAFDAGGSVGAGFVELPYEPDDGAYYATGTLELTPDAVIETWGLPIGDPSRNATCARIVGAITHFVVRLSDHDCDGIVEPDDCKPDAFCDPAATSPAAQAACTCD